MTNILNFLRSLAGLPPRAVDAVIADLSKIQNELSRTASKQNKIAGQHRRAAYVAETEAERAMRVSAKINNLLA